MAKKKKKQTLKAAIYIRVSTVEQSDNEFSSLNGQENQCRTWIEQRNQITTPGSPHIKVSEVYRDTKSGKDLKRPGIERLLKDAKAGKFDLLVVTKIDRVSRSLKDFLNFFERLEEYEVDIAAVTQEIDTSSAAGKALQRMLLVFAEFEREMVSERTREKRIETVKQGFWPGGTPRLGYDIVDRKLIINEEESILVKEIFYRYLKLKSSRDVAKALNAEGFRNKSYVSRKGKAKGGGKFNVSSILSVLNSRLYIGQYEIDGTIYKGIHDSIIEQETFDQVQKLLQANNVNPNKHQPIKSATPAILTGICTCGFCAGGMTISSTTNRAKQKYYYYKCSEKNKMGSTEEHNPKDLSVTILDDFVIETIQCLLKAPELMEAMRKRLKFEGEDQIQELESRIKRIQQTLKSLLKDKTNTLKLVTDNASSTLKETYASQLESIILNIEEKENEIEFLKNQLEQLKLRKPIGKTAHKKLLNEFITKYNDSDIGMRRELTKVLVKNVETFVNQKTNDGTINIKYLADKRLEAQWDEIKNANTVNVRIFDRPGSPGWILPKGCLRQNQTTDPIGR